MPITLTPMRASIALVTGGCLWGIYWIPMGYLEAMGFHGATAGIVLCISCLLLLSPAIWQYRMLFVRHYQTLLFSGLLTGAALSLFTTSLAYTDVIRSILLFYLAPVWGVLVGIIVLHERLTLTRCFVIAFAFTGLYVILGTGGDIPLPRNVGDVFALLSGLLWAIGSLGLLRAQSIPVMPQIIAFFVGSLLISVMTFWAIGAPLDLAISAQSLAHFGIIAFLIACYALPMIWLTIAPARVLTPARVGILLMSEVIIGTSSAALLSGEPFGARELIGTICIICAALIEIKGSQTDKPIKKVEKKVSVNG